MYYIIGNLLSVLVVSSRRLWVKNNITVVERKLSRTVLFYR